MLAKLAGRPWRGMLVINMRFYYIFSFSFVSVNACMLSRLLLSMHTILFDFTIKQKSRRSSSHRASQKFSRHAFFNFSKNEF